MIARRGVYPTRRNCSGETGVFTESVTMNTQPVDKKDECRMPLGILDKFVFWRRGTREDLIEEHYVKLKSCYQICKQNESRFKMFPVITEKIEDLFGQPCTWNNGAYIEQLMIQLYTPEQLNVELDRKLYNIQVIQNQQNHSYYQKMRFDDHSEDEKRAALVRLVADLNNAYQANRLERDYSLETSLRTGIFFILSFVVFFMQYLFPESTRMIFKISEAGSKASLILTALSAGWMGAAFSMMMSLKRRLRESSLDDLGIQRRFGFIISRIFIGMGASMVMFYCLQSGLFEGQLFPEFNNMKTLVSQNVEQSIVNHKDQALLIIWCFIAGFSESLVPAILAKTEGLAR